jgi:cell division septation protein DedD
MAERRSDREVVLTSSQVLIILLLLVILMSVVFVLGISVGKRQKSPSAQKTTEEELPPVVVKETEPLKEVPEVEKKEESLQRESVTVSKFYFIQVGAFSSEASAQAFAEKFREKNYSVKVVPPSPQDKKPVYRVRVGPYLKVEEAKDVLGKLKQTGKENYFIVSE